MDKLKTNYIITQADTDERGCGLVDRVIAVTDMEPQPPGLALGLGDCHLFGDDLLLLIDFD